MGRIGKPVTKAEAEKAVTAAISNIPSGAKEVVITIRNAAGIGKEALAAIAEKSAVARVTPIVHLDTVVNGRVIGRITLRGGSDGFGIEELNATFNSAKAVQLKNLFNKYFANELFAVCLNQQGNLGATISVAIPIPTGVKADSLAVYSYDSSMNKSVRVNTKIRVDKNGYVHFDTAIGGDFIVSDGDLVKK